MAEYFTGEGNATPGTAAHIYLGMLTAGHVVDPATFYAWASSHQGMSVTEAEMDRITRIYFAFLQQQQLLEELAGNPGSSGMTSATTPGNPGSSGGPGGPGGPAGGKGGASAGPSPIPMSPDELGYSKGNAGGKPGTGAAPITTGPGKGAGNPTAGAGAAAGPTGAGPATGGTMSTEELFRAFQTFMMTQPGSTSVPPQGAAPSVPPMPSRAAPRYTVTPEEVEHQAPQAPGEKAIPKMGKPPGPKLIHGKEAKFPPEEHQESKTKYFYLPTSVTGKEARLYSGYMCAEAAFLRGVDWTHPDIRCFRRLESSISYYFSQHSHCWTVVIEK